MSDELKTVVEEMKADLKAVKNGLEDVSGSLKEVKTSLVALTDRVGGTEGAMARAANRFGTFLVRFEEVTDMLIKTDTEQLQRITNVENEGATLKQTVDDLSKRVEVLEKKAS